MNYDDLRIQLRASGQPDAGRYQATLYQRNLPVEGGPFRRVTTVSMTEIQALQHMYARAIDDLHELGPLGIPVPPTDVEALLALGRRVAQVLPPQTRDSIQRALAHARRRQRGLRITLAVAPDALELFDVPWELITLPLSTAMDTGSVPIGGDGFLLLNADVALVRALQGAGRAQSVAFNAPLRLEVFAAQPDDTPPINTQALNEALATPIAAKTAGWYAGPGTLAVLQERLRVRSPQVIHILCHGECSDNGRSARSNLLFTHPDGYTQRVGIFDLAPALTLAPDLRMVVLEACHGGTQRSSNQRVASESIAGGLLRHGVPLVVAFGGEVGQVAAGAFARALYDELAAGEPAERAVAIGRLAMQAAGGSADWSLPVVYCGSERPEPQTPFTWLSDHIELALRDPSALRTLRAGLGALALLLIIAGLTRWLVMPLSTTPLALAQLEQGLAVWTGAGLICPAIIAVAHRGVQRGIRMPAVLRSQVLVAQWAGAYLGYALGGQFGLGLCLVLVIFGIFPTQMSAQALLLAAVIVGALLLSYTAARTQVKSAIAIAPEYPELFGVWSTCIIFVGALIMLATPYGLLWLSNSVLPWIAQPTIGAFILALALIMGVVGGGTGNEEA